jgi:hypothetical protein
MVLRGYTPVMDPRSPYLLVMLGLPALAVLNALWFGLELKNFLSATPRLNSSRDLEGFKVVVAHQMYAALVQIVLLATPPIVFFIGVFRKVLSPSDILYIIGPSAVILIVAAMYRGQEKHAKIIPTTDPELERQRDAVVQTWLRKPLPDW